MTWFMAGLNCSVQRIAEFNHTRLLLSQFINLPRQSVSCSKIQNQIKVLHLVLDLPQVVASLYPNPMSIVVLLLILIEVLILMCMLFQVWSQYQVRRTNLRHLQLLRLALQPIVVELYASSTWDMATSPKSVPTIEQCWLLKNESMIPLVKEKQKNLLIWSNTRMPLKKRSTPMVISNKVLHLL